GGVALAACLSDLSTVTLSPPPPPQSAGSSRRRFLGQLVGGAAGAWALADPWPLLAERIGESAGGAGDEAFWALVRSEFLIPEGRLYYNIGTLGPQPRVVLDAAIEAMRETAMTHPPGVDWEGLKERMAAAVGGDPEGFAFPRNTTEAMSFVANGLELRPGDEVLTTDHEHIGGLCCWQLAAARRGVELRQLPLPLQPAGPEELVALFADAITPRTRVISVSHVTFTTGLVLPVREIAALCHERGIVSVVDGAHPPGLLPVDLGAIDADFYASSPHKWLLAPQGTGFLYMRRDWRERLWPTLASGGWDDRSLGAHRFNHLGTIDESRLAGLDAALRFFLLLGAERVALRAEQLRVRLLDGLAALPRVRVVTDRRAGRSAGMASFSVAGLEGLELQRRLARKANVRSRVIGEYDYGWLRLSPHIYNTPAEVDRLLELIAAEV
ncbi:MAG TPA: aminotransferase class V-fold PLP-dependent enzyme, partial [Longimicrobiales bacterium]|nr:aminotransferase class V-fold PLP-dependent enzyme [Longimicrobiales bacterium]